MKKENQLNNYSSVKIGVTGHRIIPNKILIQKRVYKALEELDKILDDGDIKFIVISPLAEGADRIVANEILRWPNGNPQLEVVLPLKLSEYIKDFKDQKSINEFQALLNQASFIETIGKKKDRNDAYEEAGQTIVDRCDILIAIWDEKPSRGKGSSSEIVDYAKKLGREIILINSETGKITFL